MLVTWCMSPSCEFCEGYKDRDSADNAGLYHRRREDDTGSGEHICMTFHIDDIDRMAAAVERYLDNSDPGQAPHKFRQGNGNENQSKT